jgi:8-oxo-dGTP diphosphatase
MPYRASIIKIIEIKQYNMRQKIRNEFSSIVPFDELERSQIDDAIVWLDSGVELCRVLKPATPPRHLVVYFVVTDGDYVLLVVDTLVSL